MSLDFAILDNDDRVVKYVPITVDQHRILMQIASNYHLAVLLMFSDYYQDVEIKSDDMETLESEISVLMECLAEGELRQLARRLQGIIREATRDGYHFANLAD